MLLAWFILAGPSERLECEIYSPVTNESLETLLELHKAGTSIVLIITPQHSFKKGLISFDDRYIGILAPLTGILAC